MCESESYMPYYSIKVKSVSENGRDINASYTGDEWFKRLIDDAVVEDYESVDATLLAKIVRAERSLEAVGGVYLKLRVICSRCLEKFDYEEQIPFRLLLEPKPKDKGRPGKAADRDENQDDKAEEMNELVDFSYYSGDEIDIGDLIRQYITMTRPISYLCSGQCKGLCAECGKNLNSGSCSCPKDRVDSPFAVLKDLKRRSS